MSDLACSAAKHGTLNAYTHHRCRCRAAIDAQTRANKRHGLRVLTLGQPLLRDGTGTTRRLRALAAIGWSTYALADELGSTQAMIRRWQVGGTAVHIDTVTRVRAAYNRLSDTPGPGERVCRTRNAAARKGWLPPIAWDDDTIDDPGYGEDEARTALRGPETIAEAKAARADSAAELRAQGLACDLIADRLGVSERQIERDLSESAAARGAATANAGRTAECGTDGGYYRHTRTLREPACTPCKRAHAEQEARRGRRARDRDPMARHDVEHEGEAA